MFLKQEKRPFNGTSKIPCACALGKRGVPLRKRLVSFLKEPLLHFIVLGTVIFMIYAFWGQWDESDQERTITITTGEIEWLTDSWHKRWNRPPTPVEREGIINQYVREMILYREAVAMGLDQSDTIIRRRLAQKLEFITQDLSRPQPPSEDELRAYFEDHLGRYQSPDLISMTHVFFDPDKRGSQTLQDAEAAKVELIDSKRDPRNALSFGDRFMLQNYYPERSQAELAKLFGGGFAEPLFALAPQQWHGPILSGYGVHLVYVHDLQKFEPPAFSEVKDQVSLDWEDEQRKKLNDQYIENLIGQYKVTIENVPLSEPSGTGEDES